MAPTAFANQAALVALPIPASAMPTELRILEAQAAVEAAEQIAAMRGRDLDANPSEQTLRLARWAGEDLRDALDALDALRAAA